MLAIPTYLRRIETALLAGNATEHTHRPALKELIESIEPHIRATNEPKRGTFGAPDYVVTKRTVPLGYVETKDVDKNLDRLSKSDQQQLNRYLGSLNNLVLTNYLEFRWFVNGELRMKPKLADVSKTRKIHINPDGEKEVTQLLSAFLTTRAEVISSPQELAERMAGIAKLIRSTIDKGLKDKSTAVQNMLREQFLDFRRALLPNLQENEFSDLYAQTIAYGLFTARCYHRKSGFTRREAAHCVPKTNPFLRETFDRIAGINLDERIAWIVDDLAELLNRVNINSILQDFGKRTRQEDPVVHFYETFLAAYDPKLRETRGVYYTPEPVVSYIVRSVDKILQEDFNLPKGLADANKIKLKAADNKTEGETHKVLILDPATGTGTFLYSVIKNIYQRFEKNRGAWDKYVSEHLLPRLFGFEFLVAPYSVAHLKLSLLLEETGYQFNSNERLQIFLTNTLEEAFSLKEIDQSPFTHWINEEARGAKGIKQENPVMVVLGNPPYSGHSANKGKWIENLLRGTDIFSQRKTVNYFAVDGQPLDEKNLKWLNDDYVKFIRFAQWRIEQTGYGVLAFITNHGYLDNPTFRGMRQALMQTFDEIYVLDLHGNSKRKERSPDGSKDENVFDIQQGVSIGMFVKKKEPKTKEATVFHAHLYGAREEHQEFANKESGKAAGKYYWLLNHDVRTTQWTEVKPQTPFYLFVPQNLSLLTEYGKGWKITEAMPINSVGIATARDALTIHFGKDETWEIINDFAGLSEREAREKYSLGTDVRDWKVSFAQSDLKKSGLKKEKIIPILYRPFDSRFTYYTGKSRGFHCMPRSETMTHMIEPNLALSTTRAVEIGRGWEHIFCTSQIIQHHTVSIKEVNYIFPLYLYPTEKRSLFDEDFGDSKRPNLAPDLVRAFSRNLDLEFKSDGKGNLQRTFGPEDVFSYAYAVFHSPTYRTRYAEFLKIDFPRLPLISNLELFRALVKLGSKLVALHLMGNTIESLVGFPEKGDNKVEIIKYENGAVRINKQQYFSDVPESAWEFHIGGYRVAEKWLKDRRGRKLSFNDIEHYESVIAVLGRTIDLMTQIDKMIDANGGWPIK